MNRNSRARLRTDRRPAMGMEGFRTKRWQHSEEFFGIFVSRDSSLTFASGNHRVTLLPGQDFSFADKLEIGQVYCLIFHHGGTRLREISHLETGIVWRS